MKLIGCFFILLYVFSYLGTVLEGGTVLCKDEFCDELKDSLGLHEIQHLLGDFPP